MKRKDKRRRAAAARERKWLKKRRGEKDRQASWGRFMCRLHKAQTEDVRAAYRDSLRAQAQHAATERRRQSAIPSSLLRRQAAHARKE